MENLPKTDFEKTITESGIIEKKFYEAVGLTYKTWVKKKNEPWQFTAREISIVAKILRMPEFELFTLVLKDHNS